MSLLNKIIVEHYGIYAKKILLSKNIICDENSEYEVHMLTCERDFLESLWCLKTFYHYSRIRTRLIIHDDGTLSNHNVEKFKNHFVGCEIISKKDADSALKKYLKEYEFCRKYRFSNPPSALSMKLFDPVCYSRTKKILMFDADILFFKKPIEMINCMIAKKGYFMSDYQNAYALSLEDLNALLNMDIRKRVNSGLMYIDVEKAYTLDVIETFLKALNEKISSNNYFWREQTAWAILVSKQKEGFMRLPDSYQISKQLISDLTISHHFVKDGSRDDFFKKGVCYLKKRDFLKEFNKS